MACSHLRPPVRKSTVSPMLMRSGSRSCSGPMTTPCEGDSPASSIRLTALLWTVARRLKSQPTLPARPCSKPRGHIKTRRPRRLAARPRSARSRGGRRCTGGQFPDGTGTGHRAQAIGYRTTWRELRGPDRCPATMWPLGLGLSPLELPRREAPDVDVELVQAGVVAVALELNLKLQLFPRYGQVGTRAQGSDPRAAPCTVGTTGRQLTIPDDCSGLLAQNGLVGHDAPCSAWRQRAACSTRGCGARCRGLWRRGAPTSEPTEGHSSVHPLPVGRGRPLEATPSGLTLSPAGSALSG